MSDTLKVYLNNFQSITEASLEFKKGITLLVGASNSGKTATIRALKALLLNTSGSQRYIKNGTDQASVVMEYKGNVVEWTRTKKESKYNINGKEYNKVGNSNLFKLLDGESGFVTDDKNNILNIEGEWDTLSPFDKSDTELFKLYENALCVSDSAKIFTTFKSEEDILNKALQESIIVLNKDKIKIEAIEKLQDRVDLDKLKDMKVSLTNKYVKYDKLYADVNNINNIRKLVRKVPKDIKVKRFLEDNLISCIKLQKDLEIINKGQLYINCVESKNTKVKQFDFNKLAKYEKLYREVLQVNETQKLPNIQDIENLIKTLTLDKITRYLQLKKDLDTVDHIFSNADKLSNVSVVKFESKIPKYLQLKKDLDIIKEVKNNIKTLKNETTTLEHELAEINEKLTKYDTCPTCNSIIVK